MLIFQVIKHGFRKKLSKQIFSLHGRISDCRSRSECAEIRNYYNKKFKLIWLIGILYLLNHGTLIGFDPMMLMPLYQMDEEVARA
jgi:hypothetical protein